MFLASVFNDFKNVSCVSLEFYTFLLKRKFQKARLNFRSMIELKYKRNEIN